MAQVVNVLDDPYFWDTQPRPLDRWFAFAVSMSLWAVAIAALGIVVALVHEAEHAQDHDVRMQHQCVEAGGQWIKRDCINNLIQIAPDPANPGVTNG